MTLQKRRLSQSFNQIKKNQGIIIISKKILPQVSLALLIILPMKPSLTFLLSLMERSLFQISQIKLPIRPTRYVEDQIGIIFADYDKYIKQTLFDIDINTAPGPNGFTSNFFKNAWHITGSSLIETIYQSFFSYI